MSSVPQWLKKRVIFNDAFLETKKALADLSINTVCESSRCPNLNECFSGKRVTFMILGKVCTRTCGFCYVTKGEDTQAVDIEEPQRLANCVQRLKVKYAIVTSVTRDDLDDGGSGQFAETVKVIKGVSRDIVVELLIPDLCGREESIRVVANSGADIVGHNIETVNRLYPFVRSGADYSMSLGVLKTLKRLNPGILTKSAIIAGLGEKEEEIVETMKDLRGAGCDILTIGQYLKASEKNTPVDRFVTPEEFERYKIMAEGMSFKSVSSGPFVRSSYFAEDNFKMMGVLYDKSYAAAVS